MCLKQTDLVSGRVLDAWWSQVQRWHHQRVSCMAEVAWSQAEDAQAEGAALCSFGLLKAMRSSRQLLVAQCYWQWVLHCKSCCRMSDELLRAVTLACLLHKVRTWHHCARSSILILQVAFSRWHLLTVSIIHSTRVSNLHENHCTTVSRLLHKSVSAKDQELCCKLIFAQWNLLHTKNRHTSVTSSLRKTSGQQVQRLQNETIIAQDAALQTVVFCLWLRVTMYNVLAKRRNQTLASWSSQSRATRCMLAATWRAWQIETASNWQALKLNVLESEVRRLRSGLAGTLRRVALVRERALQQVCFYRWYTGTQVAISDKCFAQMQEEREVWHHRHMELLCKNSLRMEKQHG